MKLHPTTVALLFAALHNGAPVGHAEDLAVAAEASESAAPKATGETDTAIPADYHATDIAISNASPRYTSLLKVGENVDVLWNDALRDQKSVVVIVHAAKLLKVTDAKEDSDESPVVTLLLSTKDQQKVLLAKSSGSLAVISTIETRDSCPGCGMGGFHYEKSREGPDTVGTLRLDGEEYIVSNSGALVRKEAPPIKPK